MVRPDPSGVPENSVRPLQLDLRKWYFGDQAIIYGGGTEGEGLTNIHKASSYNIWWDLCKDRGTVKGRHHRGITGVIR